MALREMRAFASDRVVSSIKSTFTARPVLVTLTPLAAGALAASAASAASSLHQTDLCTPSGRDASNFARRPRLAPPSTGCVRPASWSPLKSQEFVCCAGGTRRVPRAVATCEVADFAASLRNLKACKKTGNRQQQTGRDSGKQTFIFHTNSTSGAAAAVTGTSRRRRSRAKGPRMCKALVFPFAFHVTSRKRTRFTRRRNHTSASLGRR